MSLTAGIRYEKLAQALGNFPSFYAQTAEQVRESFRKALEVKTQPTLINIAINPSADRKAQVTIFIYIFIFKLKHFNDKNLFFKDFPWLTKSKI